MSSSTPSSMERFILNARGLFNLISELVENAHKQGFKIVNPKLVGFAGIVLFNIDKSFVINKFIEKSHLHWDKILNKDDTFFFENASDVFVGLPTDKINAFKDLYSLKNQDGTNFVEDDDKDALWEYFESLVRISITYLLEDSSRNKFNLDLPNLCLKWKIN
jgi:hypothetical protein